MMGLAAGLALQGAVLFARVELTGPLSGARWTGSGAALVEFDLELGPGERRLWRVPAPEGAAAARSWAVEGTGSARVLELETPASNGSAAGIPAASPARPHGLPAGLPPVGGGGGARGLGWGAWASLVGGLLAVLGLRRRPLVALAAGLLAGGAAAFLTLGEGGPGREWASAEVQVLDGRAGARRWGLLRGGAGRLALAGEGPIRAWALPAQALCWRVSESAGPGAEGPRIELRLPGAQLYMQSDIPPGLRVLSPAFNGWSAASEAWSRSPGGPWRFHGPWPLHAGLPPAIPAGGAHRSDPLPPSWLSAGLPPGAGALVLRLAPGSDPAPSLEPPAGSDSVPDPASGTWLRFVLEE